MHPPFRSKHTALVEPNRWLVPSLLGVALFGALGPLLAIMGLGPMLFAGLGPAVFTLGLVGALVAYRRNPWTHDTPLAIEASEEGVRAGGALLLSRGDIPTGFVLPDLHEGPKVRLTRKLRRPLEIRVRDEDEGRAVLRALGLDASQVAVTFGTTSRLLSEPKLSIPFAIVIVLFALAMGASARLVGGDVGPLRAPIILVLAAVFALLRTKLTVGADGVLRTWLWQKHFFPWADVTDIDTYVDDSFWASNKRWQGVQLTLQSGETVRFPIVQGRALDKTQMTLIHARMKDARDSHTRGDASAEAAQLERHARSIPAWIASLRAIGSGANQDHRTAPVVPERLWRIVEDPAATAAARAGAAIALGGALDDGGKKRLSAAAEAVAAPQLRIALEAAAGGDEEALREALSEMEEGEKRSL